MPQTAKKPFGTRLLPYFVSVAGIALSVGIAYALESVLLPSNLSLVFLPAVLFSALRFGLWPAIVTATLGVLAWDFLFLPPLYKFNVDEPQDLLALLLFLVIALVVSNLAALQFRQKEAIAARARTTAQLYEFGQQVAAAASTEDLLSAIPRAIGTIMECETLVLMPNSGVVRVAAGHPQRRELDTLEDRQAQASWKGAVVSRAGRMLFHPLRTQGGVIGVLALGLTQSQRLPPDEERLRSILIDQAAVAIERAALAQKLEKARLEVETERLRSAMLTSVSHDLRTPLTVIIGALSTIKSFGTDCEPALRVELLDRAQSEAERLHRFIGNLLDMTMLESGRLKVTLEPVDPNDAIESALRRAGSLTAEHTVSVAVPPDVPMVESDFMLLEQVVFNVVDNAAKYAPAGSTILISSHADGAGVVVEIADEGSGIPPEALETIFDKFGAHKFVDSRRPGTGLGLAICRGFLAAMGGTITAANRADGQGALMRIRLRPAEITLPLD